MRAGMKLLTGLLLWGCTLWLVPGDAFAAPGGEETGGGHWRISYANLEPDHFLPVQPDTVGSRLPPAIGGYIHIIAVNAKGGSDRIEDVLVNGVSLAKAFAPKVAGAGKPPLYGPQLAPGGVPDALLRAGEPIWYRILPCDEDSTLRWTEVTVRLRHWHGQ